MTPDERQQLINQYKAGYDEVINSLKDFPVDDLTAHPVAGKWSACEIVHHLADSETASALRLRKLLTETDGDEPTRVVVNEPTRRISMERETELVRTARRHPATIALIQEITAQVEASAERRIELAKTELRAGLVFHHGLFHRMDLVTLGVFTTVNLLLVTAAFALAHVMAPWLAGLLVTGVSFAGPQTTPSRPWTLDIDDFI